VIKPTVLFSRCLGFEACRWNGETIHDNTVEKLKPWVEAITICPEKEIGLGIPRDPIRIIERAGAHCLIQPSSARDITEEMQTFSRQFLSRLPKLDGALLKHRSPSCGIADVKLYADQENRPPQGKTSGFFARELIKRYPLLPLEDEGRLKNYQIRETFFTRIFTLARFREAQMSGDMKDLIEFQAAHKLLLLSFNITKLRILGRIVANHEKLPLPTVWTNYGNELMVALHKPPRFTNNINVLMHAFGYFSNVLTSSEKAFFLHTLDTYRNGKTPLSVSAYLLQSWIIRFNEPYLSKQIFFQPFPAELTEITDSGKGRDT